MNLNYLILKLFLVAQIWKENCCELFSSTEELRWLLPTQADAVASLERSLHELERLKLNLKETISMFNEHNIKANEEKTEYVYNPLNAFTMIKRLVVDYPDITLEVHQTLEKIDRLLRKKPGLTYPEKSDLSGSVKSIVRVIDTFKLDHRNLSDGRVDEDQGLPMTSKDCHVLAKELMKQDDYEYAYIWLEEAAKKFHRNGIDKVIDIVIDMADCKMKLGDLKYALYLCEDVLAIFPENKPALLKKKELMATVAKNGNNWNVVTEKKAHPEPFISIYGDATFEELCREEYQPHPDFNKRLKCFYKNGKHPYLRIAPFKVEEIHPSASVLIYHDILHDNEIKSLKRSSKPALNRTNVFLTKTGENTGSDARISQSAWLNQKDDAVFSRLFERVHLMTDTNLKTMESVQVTNYGIGGHFHYHYDFAPKDFPFPDPFEAKKLATVLLYLSDVTKGGGTTFPYLGVTIPPSKGSAAFWLNYLPSGEGNRLTLHAGCPVLLGEKWVGNAWINLAGQMDTYPCSLEYQDENQIRRTDLKSPVRR